MSRLKAAMPSLAVLAVTAAIAVPVAVGQSGDGDGKGSSQESSSNVPDVTREFQAPEEMQKFQQCMSEQGIEPPPPPTPPMAGEEPRTEELPEPPENLEEALEACEKFVPEGAPGPMGGPPPAGMPCDDAAQQGRGSEENTSVAPTEQTQAA